MLTLVEEKTAAMNAAKAILDRAKAAGDRDLTQDEAAVVRAHLNSVEKLNERIKSADETKVFMDQIAGLTPGEMAGVPAGKSFVPEAELKAMWSQARTGANAVIELPGRKAMIGSPTPPIVTPGLTGGIYTTGGSLADLFPHARIDGPVQRFYRTTAVAAVAAVTAEGAPKPDAGLAIGFFDATVSKIAAIAKLSEELLSDFPSFQREIGNEVAQAIKVRENAVFAAQLLGTSGIVVSTPAAGVNAADALADAVATAQVNGVNPSGVAMAPADLAKLRKLKDTTGNYILDSPTLSVTAASNVFPVPTIWGLPVVATPSLPLNTVLIGDFANAGVVGVRDPLRVELGYDAADWSTNQRTLRVEERLLLAVTAPGRITKITLS